MQRECHHYRWRASARPNMVRALLSEWRKLLSPRGWLRRQNFGRGKTPVPHLREFKKMSETIERVKQKQGIISKIQDIFTLGYSTKEDLRELDKKLRDYYYADFKSLRHRWEEIYLEALNAKQPNGADYKKGIQVTDRVAEKINRADYGYAGLMDRKGHIRENELAKVFDYDKALGADINMIEQTVEELYRDVEAEKWSEAPVKVRAIKLMLLDLETKWDSREREFRPLEV